MEEGNKKVEGTEEKPEGLIDRFWWVIPPVFLTFVYWSIIRGIFFTLTGSKNATPFKASG
jgi:hypothetical protein